MNIYLVSLFPDLIEQACSYGVLGRAIKQKQLTLHCFNPRDFTEDKHRTVDDRPYGGGPGMLMKVEPLYKAIMAAKELADMDSVKSNTENNVCNSRVIYLSPQGKKLDQQLLVKTASEKVNLILIAGRYEGIDERIIESLVDEEWSIGDYVLSGGEFAALVVVDAITRLIPSVLGDDESALQDSFMQESSLKRADSDSDALGLLDYPHYTRPECLTDGLCAGQSVPDVLLSGDHQAIRRWRLKQSIGRTWYRRPDLLEELKTDASYWDEEKENLLAEFITEFGDETKENE